MEAQSEHPTEEIKRLRRCINDLVSLRTLPAMWAGGEPSQIVRSLLDVLLDMLDLDLIYARLEDQAGNAPIEMVRVARPQGLPVGPQEVGALLNRCLGDAPKKWPPFARNRIGDADLLLVPLQMGLQGDVGVIVAGSQRPDFPGQTERLLLSVAANQAAIALQGARLLSEQKRVATELDQRVARRTSELAAANEELRKKIAEGNLAEEKLREEEKELRRGEARKTAILDSALDCIVTIDHEGCITEFNPASERTFGYRRDEVVGKQLADVIIPPSLREMHREGFARYLATGSTRVLGRRIEMTAVRADGSEFPVELAITRIPFDGPPSFTGYLRDITERKQSEEKLRRSEAYLSEGQRLSHTGSWAWKVKTKENLFWSKEHYCIYGFDPDAEIVQYAAARERIHPDDACAFDETLDRAIQARSDFETQHRIIVPGGAIKHLHILGHPMFDDSGELVEYIGTVMDVTERQRSEEALRKAQANLSHIARLTTVGELTASIAHEVNQPLAAVVTNANACLRWLDHEPPNFEEVRVAIRRIIRDGNRGSEVIRRIRGLVKKERAPRERLDVNEVVRETLALVQLDLKGTVLRTELGVELPHVQADRVQLQQVLLNLAMNAMDAMKPVTDGPHVLLVQTKYHAEQAVLVVVRDSGVGVNPGAMEKLFETFYTTKPEGLGMGLSICRSIIEGHGGRLWAERNEGSGTTFQFTLPIESEGAA